MQSPENLFKSSNLNGNTSKIISASSVFLSLAGNISSSHSLVLSIQQSKKPNPFFLRCKITDKSVFWVEMFTLRLLWCGRNSCWLNTWGPSGGEQAKVSQCWLFYAIHSPNLYYTHILCLCVRMFKHGYLLLWPEQLLLLFFHHNKRLFCSKRH